jgi:hypothetical protein
MGLITIALVCVGIYCWNLYVNKFEQRLRDERAEQERARFLSTLTPQSNFSPQSTPASRPSASGFTRPQTFDPQRESISIPRDYTRPLPGSFIADSPRQQRDYTSTDQRNESLFSTGSAAFISSIPAREGTQILDLQSYIDHAMARCRKYRNKPVIACCWLNLFAGLQDPSRFPFGGRRDGELYLSEILSCFQRATADYSSTHLLFNLLVLKAREVDVSNLAAMYLR